MKVRATGNYDSPPLACPSCEQLKAENARLNDTGGNHQIGCPNNTTAVGKVELAPCFTYTDLSTPLELENARLKALQNNADKYSAGQIRHYRAMLVDFWLLAKDYLPKEEREELHDALISEQIIEE